ncbi:MAG TPA: TRAP transporter substrate-binding protein [Alphaproteobacteria bacterium]
MRRRAFLKGVAAGAAAGALPAPALAGDKLSWKLVTCWPRNFPALGTGSQRLADSITAMSGGRLTVKVYGAGELVPAFEAFDAVREGIAEMCHDAPYYWIAKHPATAFFCSVPGGLTAQEQASWIYFGGGQALWDELYADFGLTAFLAGSGGPNVGGWFRKEINSVDDFKGLRMRIPGLGGELLNRMGATTVNLPGAEILPALQTGAIDAAEWVAPYNDLAFGFHKVAKYYYAPGVHEPAPAGALTVNRKAFEALPADLQEIVRRAAGDEALRMLAEMTAGNGAALEVLIGKHGVQLRRFPPDVYRALMATAAEVVADTAAKDPFTARVYQNWSAFRQKQMALAPLTELGYMTIRAAS